MASEKTPNLGLNQIDRTSPKTTYFDLEKYLDQNWRAVDNFAGDVNDGVDAIKKRLDTTERKEVTLSPGVQIVHAEKASPFSLTGLSGRTLVNLLGRWGNLSSLTGITPYQSEIALDTTNKGTMSNSLKVTIKSGYTVGVGFYSDFKFLAGKYYVAIAKVKVGNSANAGISAPNVQEGTTVTDKTKFTTSWFRAAPTSNVTSNIDLRIQGTQGQYSYFEAVRIYEISSADYTALASMTGEQIAAKYPYVDSIMPARNPYAIRYGENLLPPFYEWQRIHANAKILGPYSLTHTKTDTSVGESCSAPVLPVVPNTSYYLKNGSAGVTMKVWFSADGLSFTETASIDTADGTFKTPAYCNYILVETYIKADKTGKFTSTNPMLNIGSTAKPFKPREDSMIALQTDLYADPVTGTNADTVFERDGQYFKSKKWNGIVLDGSLPWVLDASYTGSKQVAFPVLDGVGSSAIVYKYDGKIIGNVLAQVPDTQVLHPILKQLFITVSSADSGWGDGYTPSADEIKAYFNGWNMYYWNGTSAEIFKNQGPKSWRQINNHGATTSVLPTTQVTPGMSKDGRFVYWEPYRLVYQLATPTVEPIVSEGQLSFIEGDNQVEVGTGVVLRERAKPAKYDNYDINTGKSLSNATAYRVASYVALYENGKSKLRGWGVFTGIDNGQAIAIYPEGYVSDASYSVTYLMLDRSPIVPFTGSRATNEKTLLLDLVDNVQQNTSRVSALENKKADKDNPSWITPTLLNGVTAETSSVDIQPQYLKMSDNLIKMHGSIKVPTSNATVTFIKLPEGYRPKILTVLTCAASDAVSGDKTAVIAISPDGRVEVVGRGGYGWIRLDAVQFIAEV
ncbi:hypothetical protein ACIFOE_24375 [Paenibacillus sp. NRS-1783]|uniref:hypothetical protein n=1 Tax=Paenibacillus sp. NRS-1783 TaxID=3233907 RepID=UPI003D298FA3